MLPLMLLALLIWGAVRFTKRRAAKNGEGGACGVGGWLLLLVCGLLFLGPLIGAGRINADFIAAEGQFPNLLTVQEWATFKKATWWTFLVVCCLSIYAGYGLLKRRERSAVTQAKAMLWIIGPVANMFMGVVLPGFIFGRFEVDAQVIGALLASAAVSLIWTLYLIKSERVKSTYQQ